MKFQKLFAFGVLALFVSTPAIAEELTYNVTVQKQDGSVLDGSIVVETDSPNFFDDEDLGTNGIFGFYGDFVVSANLTCTAPDGTVRLFALDPDGKTPVQNDDGAVIFGDGNFDSTDNGSFTVATTTNTNFVSTTGIDNTFSLNVFNGLLTPDGEISNSVVCICLLYTSPSPRDATLSRMPSSA